MRLPYGETWTVLRRPSGRDRTGDGGAVAHHTIEECAFVWDEVTEVDDRRDTSIQFGTLFVPKGSDVLASDQLENPHGEVFSAVGRPKWDQVHPMTGWDPEYKVVRLKGVF